MSIHMPFSALQLTKALTPGIAETLEIFYSGDELIAEAAKRIKTSRNVLYLAVALATLALVLSLQSFCSLG